MAEPFVSLTTMSSNTEIPTAPSEATTATKPTSLATKKPSGGARLPSLNQLAARITSNAGGTPPVLQPNNSSAPRPRLAAFALRTGSNASLSTVASTADSMAVNAPSTRSASPAMSNASQQSNATTGGTPLVEGGDPLTTEKLEKLNEETASADGTVKIAVPVEAPKKKVGYKNIPSLDAITARLAKQRAMHLSIDGSAMPPEPEMVEDPKTPGVHMKAPEHPLEFSWCVIVHF